MTAAQFASMISTFHAALTAAIGKHEKHDVVIALGDSVLHILCSCLVRFSKFMANFQLCKCPMCESWIYNLVPYTPVMIQPGREVSEILREIEQYNRENELGREVGELLGGMKQHDRQHKVGFSFFTKYGDLIDRVDVVMDTIFSTIRFITLLMHIVHTIYDLRLWPNGMLLLDSV
ncbi:hypothetical protein SASPL_156695 [Salvia splendens]|uniref:Uncharacterized protein n=1 Tax=Salvia splendens TaxID=180675 RepID=A0A8X8YWQ0_SALSN|nr:hypothetical protein SASPL_156695 [Salvia splendens]